jgi:alkanesulfonate monooxygenase SsuD/methylene tetrahydromethanopterin reductase-like flavin-dependent oxidoreductase (luciferase family)
LLAGECVTFEGGHIQVHEAQIRPTPENPVPIIIGGRSDAALARAARAGDGWIGIWLSPRRFAAAVQAVQAHAQDGRQWAHALNVWCGLGQTKQAAREAVARGMQQAYHLPYENFERWSPAGTPADVAEFLAPYIDAGCSTVNLIPCGQDVGETVAMAAEVRALLRRHVAAPR